MLDRSTLPATAVLNLRPTISAAVLDEGAVLLDLESKYFYALNSSAWAIAQLFESGTSMEEAIRQALSWGAPEPDGIATFVERLQSFGLLETGDVPGGDAGVVWSAAWIAPTIEQQAEPLQKIMVSAFDPSIPLAE